MQLRLSFEDAESTATPQRAPLRAPLVFVRNARARRYILRVLPDGTARVTIPRRGSRKEAERFAATHQTWIEQQRQRRLRLRSRQTPGWRDPQTVLLRGASLTVQRVVDARGMALQIGEVRVPLPERGGDPASALAGHLRRTASEELPARLVELAESHRLQVSRITVRDQRTRWGSCSARGAISLNWRLIQMPDRVRDYVLLHELMHLKEANHSRRFWRLVAGVCPDYQESRRWLRTHETLLLGSPDRA
jgi:predicted metal-dependent hydrolase